MFVELGVGVCGVLLLVTHARIKLALDALQVTLLRRSTWSGMVGGDGGLALSANLLSHQQGEHHKYDFSLSRLTLAVASGSARTFSIAAICLLPSFMVTGGMASSSYEFSCDMVSAVVMSAKL